MVVALVYAFDTCLDRIHLLKKYYTSKGFDVVSVTSNFSHRKKAVYQAEADVVIPVREYHKNLSADRILSHIEFSKKARKAMEDIQPDLIHCIIPCNTLVKEMAKYKKKHHNVKVMYDIIDLWPESMPIDRYKGLLPFKIWKNNRDKYLSSGDVVFCECELFKKYVHCGNVLYWAIDRECLPMNPYLSEDELQFCYLGSINNIIDIPRITAFLRECSAHKKCTLHIIGDGENKEYFIQEVLCVGVNVVDHKEVYDPVQKQEIFDQCNYGFNVMKSSVVVGLTMKSLDYMCAGLPIINTIKGDTKDFCEEWDIGFNLNKSNIKEMANIVCSESMDVQLQRRKNIQNLYNTYFTTKHFKEKTNYINYIFYNSFFDHGGFCVWNHLSNY